MSHVSVGNYLYVDDCMLQQGTSTTYTPSHPVEIQTVFDETAQPGHVYFTTDTPAVALRAYNSTAGTLMRTINYRIYDSLNRPISATGTISATVRTKVVTATSGTSADTLSLAVGTLTGAFHYSYWQDGENGTMREGGFSVIPPTTTSADASSSFGTQPNYTAYQTLANRRNGFKWFRTLSPAGGLSRWCLVEPVDNTFVYQDAEFDAAQSRGITTLFNLGYQPPGWAVLPTPTADQCNAVGGLFNTSASGSWEDYVTKFVTHYRAHVGGTDPLYYEIWNEPFAIYRVAYPEILYRAILAIEAADVNARIVCMGGLQKPEFLDEVINKIKMDHGGFDIATHCYAYSVHIYPQGIDPAEFTPYIGSGGGGLPQIWNTESGYKSLGPFTSAYANWTSQGTQIFPFQDAFRFYEEFAAGAPTFFASEYARELAAGFAVYQQYDARQQARPNTFEHAFSIMNTDINFHTKGTALSMMRDVIDHTTGHANVSMDDNSQFFPFTTMGDPVAVMYSTDHHPRTIALSGVHNDYALIDMMGNQVAFTGTTIPYGRIPNILYGIGLSEATLASRLGAGAIATSSDTTKPYVTIDYAPIGTTPYTTQQLRWHAIDDQSWPNYGEFVDPQGGADPSAPEAPAPEAITYSYKLAPRDSSFSAYSPSSFINATGLNGSYTLTVRAKDEAGNISDDVVWSFNVGGGSPATIVTQPMNISVTEGARATFTVVAAGSPAPTYQWYKNAVSIMGATSASYTTPPTVLADSGGLYSVVVANDFGSQTSVQALLNVIATPPVDGIAGSARRALRNAGSVR